MRSKFNCSHVGDATIGAEFQPLFLIILANGFCPSQGFVLKYFLECIESADAKFNQ